MCGFQDVRGCHPGPGVGIRRRQFYGLHLAVWQLRDKDRVLVLDAMLSKTDVMELYRACDCFVSLHRAEGFGRGIAEALLLGLDVIATCHGGNVDFCRKAGARLVAHKDIPLKPGDYVEGAGKYWAEPDIEDAGRAMQEKLGTDPLFSRDSTKIPDADLLKTLFSFESIGTRYRTRLHQISGSGFPYV